MFVHRASDTFGEYPNLDVGTSYRAALDDLDRNIVQRLSRGNVRMQMGAYLTKKDLDALAMEADAAMERLNKLSPNSL